MNNEFIPLKQKAREYLPIDFKVTNWEALQPYFEELNNRPLHSKEELERWLKDMSELEAVVSEDACWRQIRMTCDTENKELEAAFTFFVMEIQPKIQPIADLLNRKMLDNPLTEKLDQQKY